MLSVIIIYDYLCTRVHLYTIVICADGAFNFMCPYLLLVASCAICHWLGVFTGNMCLCGYHVITDILMSMSVSL